MHEEIKEKLDGMVQMTTSAIRAVNEKIQVHSDRLLALEQAGIPSPVAGTEPGAGIGGTGHRYSLQAAICHQVSPII